jgi:hypothetical protein
MLESVFEFHLKQHVIVYSADGMSTKPMRCKDQAAVKVRGGRVLLSAVLVRVRE